MTRTSTFQLPARLGHKAAAERIAADDAHLARIEETLAADIARVEQHLSRALARQTGDAQGRVEREATVDHFRRRLRGLRGYRRDAVLGRMSPADGGAPLYIGRLAVHAQDGTPLLVDWRSPAAAPFFAATRADPKGLLSRRRYRWADGRIRDYWDESLGAGARRADESPDEESALLASLERARTPQMAEVLTTLAADQDAIIRADPRGPLVVAGGPGTGKTVVALHRAAYLLYTDPRLRTGGDGVLVVGPHHPYLHYVADVLPSLGEDGVRTCTLVDLVPEGEQAPPEPDPETAALKGSRAMVTAIEPAVALHEEPPQEAHAVETPWGRAMIEAEDWADAFAAPDPGTPHNLAREQIWEELAEIVGAQLAGHPGPDPVRVALGQDEELVGRVHRAWPLLQATDVLADLYEVPAYLRRCAPSLSGADRRLLQREEPRRWTLADLPLLDALRHRLGDPGTEARRLRQRAARRETVEEIELMVDYLIDSDSSEMKEMSMLRGEDLRNALEDSTPVEIAPPDELAGPFAHVIVDEAQELDDAQWGMILRRCPSRSLTLVGDRAQARHGVEESWQERLGRVGMDRVRIATLSLNYRTPSEIMAEAAPVIRAALPDVDVPTSLRDSGVPVRYGRPEELAMVLEEWLGEHEAGTAAVIADSGDRVGPGAPYGSRVRVLTPDLVKGLEFDFVVLMRPDSYGAGTAGAVARYVAMTRSTRELVILRD